MNKVRLSDGANLSKDKRKRRIFTIAVSIILALAIIVGAFAYYVGDYYRADQEAIGAFASMNAADGIQEQYPEIEDWYIGGHSLGGSMAASYLVDHVDDYEGLILLGSYSTVDLSETDFDVLSVYGSEDKVLNRDKYDENKSNLPSDFIEVVIDGGCHAYFGMYGAQDGDGKPAISNEEQIYLTVENIVKVME
ncbi:MAG: hypothetical protein IJ324_07055 [Lachnospiraceae bacterium]|nr:hypothetical protein [Lachnospiraceae bacterium]